MKAQTFNLVRYDADKGYVFDWKIPRSTGCFEEGTKKEEHLYAKTLFIGANDSIDNYIEVPDPAEG